jgi:RimJ/RimL family protein N-acetyltransferase
MDGESRPAPEDGAEDGYRDLTGIALTTGRLVLAAPTEADIDAITAICQDPDIQANTAVPAPYDRRDAENFVAGFAPAGRSAGTDAVFGIYHATSGELLGMVGLHHIRSVDTPDGTGAEIGYWTAAQARGQGYTTEAVRAVCRWAFGDLGLDWIKWVALAGNHASLRVARKSGFRVDPDSTFRHDHRGRRQDMWAGVLLRGGVPD